MRSIFYYKSDQKLEIYHSGWQGNGERGCDDFIWPLDSKSSKCLDCGEVIPIPYKNLQMMARMAMWESGDRSGRLLIGRNK